MHLSVLDQSRFPRARPPLRRSPTRSTWLNLRSGSASKVCAGLEAVAVEYGTDELMVLTIAHDHDARPRSYELIARELTLVAP
jgi:alkanesulfonate monooxygenase SsuD/methylene tetrahydromethanopterin reductase-like flavin-dependent oxidoreductase (luciferase family)